MAKIRVYELAKELKIPSKDLIKKLNDMNIPVSSHTSSLEDEVIEAIRADLLGKKKINIEDSKNRPTVILRRKKKDLSIEEAVPHIKEIISQNHNIVDNIKIDNEQLIEDKNEYMPDYKESNPNNAEINNLEFDKKDYDIKKESIDLIDENKDVQPVKTEKNIKDIDLIKEIKENDQSKYIDKEKKPIPKYSNNRTAPKNFSKDSKSKKQQIPAKIIKLPTVQIQEKVSEKVKEKFEKVKFEKVKENIDDKKNKENKEKELVFENSPIVVTSIEEQEELNKKKKKWKKISEDNYKEKEKKVIKKKPFSKKEIIESSDLYSEEETRIRKIKKSSNKPKQQQNISQQQQTQITTPKAIKRRIKIDESIIVSDLAKRMGVKASDIITKLINLGILATVNQFIEYDTAALIAAEFNYEIEKASFEEETFIKREDDDPNALTLRPPVVTIMGHVDHGKTSLLDVIRKTKITEIEAGGITQHIGAYHVATNRGQVVFLDTPGHEAFTNMRARGAQITDIVVLVVAADDGVMPQTIEAINHAKAAKVPIIVAVNKIDKPNADTDRVLRELSEQGLLSEAWGGDTIFVNVSAKKNIGIDELLEMISIQSEVLDLKANSDKLARGSVIEAKLDLGRGPVATVLIKEGSLKAGEYVICGIQYGKIRAILNDRGVQIDKATPSIPVEILGLSGVPNAGDELIAVEDEKTAKQISISRGQKQRFKDLSKTGKLSLEKLYEKMKEGEIKGLNLIIKADVLGSIEALSDSLIKLSNEEVKINVIHSATGAIIESDISLANVSNAIIIGFNVRPSGKIQALAQEEGIDIRYYNIIYNAIKDVKDAILGMMASTFEERTLGHAEVRNIFQVPKIGTIAGCGVTDGKIARGNMVRLVREGVVIYEGKISSLKRFKDDAKEVLNGFECGIGIEKYNDIKIGDIIECFYMEEIKPEL